MSIRCEIHPVRLVQLGTDQEVEIVNLVVLTYERSCQSDRQLDGLDSDVGEFSDSPVNPSFVCALIVVTTLLNIAAGTTCTSSSRTNPHSLDVRKSIIFCESCDRFCRFATIE